MGAPTPTATRASSEVSRSPRISASLFAESLPLKGQPPDLRRAAEPDGGVRLDQRMPVGGRACEPLAPVDEPPRLTPSEEPLPPRVVPKPEPEVPLPELAP